MALETKRFYDFAEFRLDPSEKVLLRDGQPVPLTPKVFDTLRVLIENAGRLLEKDELMEKIWQDRFVEEGNLAFNIKVIRKALGDDAAKPRFVQTVPRRGYRFIADVRHVETKDQNSGTVVEASLQKLNHNPASPAAFPHPINQDTTQPSGAVVALADWRRETDENLPVESAADFQGEITAAKTPQLEIVSPLGKDQRRNNLLVLGGLIAVMALAALGYGLYQLFNRNNPSDVRKSNTLRLTSNGKTKFAAVAPDGKFAAYVIDDEDQQSIWLKNIATASDAQILPPAENTEISSLTFSPDGNFIYYSAKGALFQLPVLGGNPKKVLSNGGNSISFNPRGNSISFSPDGRQLAFIRFSTDGEETTSLAIVNADGTNERILSSSKRPDIFLRSPAWSPDGKVIACVALTADGYQKVLTVRVDDGAVSTLPSLPWQAVLQAVWRPDGSDLLVVAKDEKNILYQIWSLSYPGGELRKLTDDSHNYEQISLSADTSLLVAVRVEQEAHLWLMSGDDASRAKPLTSGFEKYDGVYGIIWTTDGKIIYGNFPSGYRANWSIDVDGRGLKELTLEGVAEAVSPDGNFLVYQSKNAEGVGLFRLDLQDGENKRLTTGTDVYPTISPDGQYVVFTRWAEDVSLWKVPLEGGEAVKLTNNPGYSLAPAISPDGKFIGFFHSRNSKTWFPALAIIPIEGGNIIKEFDVLIETSQGYRKPALQWTPDGKAINYISLRDNVSNIWRQPVDGSPPVQVTNFESGRIFSFSYSPGGKQLALSRGTFNRDVILINNPK